MVIINSSDETMINKRIGWMSINDAEKFKQNPMMRNVAPMTTLPESRSIGNNFVTPATPSASATAINNAPLKVKISPYIKVNGHNPTQASTPLDSMSTCSYEKEGPSTTNNNPTIGFMLHTPATLMSLNRKSAPPPKVGCDMKGAGIPSLSRNALETRGLSPDPQMYSSYSARQRKVIALSASEVVTNNPGPNPLARGLLTQSQPNFGDSLTHETDGYTHLMAHSSGFKHKFNPRSRGADIRRQFEHYSLSAEGKERRKKEKNYSDFFDTDAPRCDNIQEPSSVTITNQLCSWTDPKTEVVRRRQEIKAVRNASRSPPRTDAKSPGATPISTICAIEAQPQTAPDNNTHKKDEAQKKGVTISVDEKDKKENGSRNKKENGKKEAAEEAAALVATTVTGQDRSVSRVGDTTHPMPPKYKAEEGKTSGQMDKDERPFSPTLRGVCPNHSSLMAHTRYNDEMHSNLGFGINTQTGSPGARGEKSGFIKKQHQRKDVFHCGGAFTNRAQGRSVYLVNSTHADKCLKNNEQTGHNKTLNNNMHWSGAKTARGSVLRSSSNWDQARHRKLCGLQSDPSALFGGYNVEAS